MKVGQRVKILEGMREFIGKTGTVLYSEQDGYTRMYRVRLDKPVMVDGVGLVEDDLWARAFLKIIR